MAMPDCAPDCDERADCPLAGTPNHKSCGRCAKCGVPIHHTCAHQEAAFLRRARVQEAAREWRLSLTREQRAARRALCDECPILSTWTPQKPCPTCGASMDAELDYCSLDCWDDYVRDPANAWINQAFYG